MTIIWDVWDYFVQKTEHEIDWLKVCVASSQRQTGTVCRDQQKRYENEPLFFKSDETWVYGQAPKSKLQSSHWKSPRSPNPKKAWQVKTMLFFKTEGTAHNELIPSGFVQGTERYRYGNWHRTLHWQEVKVTFNSRLSGIKKMNW